MKSEKVNSGKKRIVPSKASIPIHPSPKDPIAKMILGHFDESLKKDFITFLQEKEKAPPVKKETKKGKYKQEGKEPISFREITSHQNPNLTASSFMDLTAIYNPETIDVSTFTMMRRDHQLASGLAVIKLPITALSWTVYCGDEKILKTVEWALARIWRDLIKSSLMAVDYGFASHEKVWERGNVKISHVDKKNKEEVYHDGDLVYFKKIKPHHPESIKMVFNEVQDLIEIVQEGQVIVSNLEMTLPIRKCFLFTHDKEFGNPFGVSRLKNAYKVWYWKQLLYQFMMQYFERRGTPPTVATAPPGRTLDSSGAEIDNLEMALRVASSLISSSVAVLPYQQPRDGGENMWKLELLTDDARGAMFIEALDHLDARALRAIFVPEGIWTSGGGSGGGYSGSSIHADLFLMAEKGLITDLEEAINNQLIKPFVAANYPADKVKPCYVKFDPLDWNRKITLKEIFIELIRNVDTMIQMGVPPTVIPDLEKMADILEIPTSTWEDATGVSPAKLFKAANPANNQPEDSEDSSDDLPGKVAGRKKTRGTSSDQTQDRRKINPGGKRSERIRTPNPQKKQ